MYKPERQTDNKSEKKKKKKKKEEKKKRKIENTQISIFGRSY
jgi:hypothetical protein